ncbi:hypothetical protein BD779DRAFT_1477334 [Infundibulicybe gibba]|nr:hypothetical protein BD779DRAFT_1477334 [Infundibulicybe gibba]
MFGSQSFWPLETSVPSLLLSGWIIVPSNPRMPTLEQYSQERGPPLMDLEPLSRLASIEPWYRSGLEVVEGVLGTISGDIAWMFLDWGVASLAGLIWKSILTV